MKLLKSILTVRFDEIKTSRSDGLIAIIFYLYYMTFIYLFGLLLFKTDFLHSSISLNSSNINLYRFILYIPVSILSILPVILMIWFRKQEIRTIGIKFNKISQSLMIGLIGSIPFIISPILGLVKQSAHFQYNISDTIWIFLYYFINIALVEEIGFRGFIQTRINGLIKNKWVSVLLVGLMFGFMHVPFQMIQAKMSFIEFIFNDMFHLIITVIIHVYFVYLYTRNNNILSSTITHTLIDFIPKIIN